MEYYTVSRIGTGTGDDPFRPDVPPGTSWVGHTDGTDYLIATPAVLPTKVGRTKQLPRRALEAAAKARGLTYEIVTKGWWVSDGTEPVSESLAST